jgi:hypothetical protein
MFSEAFLNLGLMVIALAIGAGIAIYKNNH